MAYLNYVTLIHYLICVACLCFTLYASLILLFKKSKVKNAQASRTPVVYVYFWFTASSSILLLINAAYCIALWRPEVVLYSPTALYYIAGLPTIFVNFVPVADFYLCFDRCFLVAFPLTYRRNYPFYMAVLFGATIGGILATYFLATRYFSYYTPESTTSCFFYICLVYALKYPMVMLYTKNVFCSLNGAATAALILLNHFKKSMHKEVSRKINRSVMLVSIINLAFSFIPAFISNMFTQVINQLIN